MKYQIIKLCEEVNNKGWVAFHHPRSKTVSINGGRELSYKDAIVRMREMLAV